MVVSVRVGGSLGHVKGIDGVSGFVGDGDGDGSVDVKDRRGG